jgi:hypothetical protein
MSPQTALEALFKEKRYVLEFFFIAVIVSFGVNLCAAGFINGLIMGSRTELLIGASLLVIALVYFLTRVIKSKNANYKLRGFVVFDNRKKTIMPVDRYDYSERISRDLEAAMNENPAIRTRWSKDPLNRRHEIKGEEISHKKSSSHSLLVQLTEYYLLDKISTHLVDYFNSDNFDDKNLVKYERKDIPGALLQNTFLELFSRPMKDRPQFVKSALKDEGAVSANKTYWMFSNGCIYNYLELVLPKNSRINKDGEEKIKIETPRFSIGFDIEFHGINTNLPQDFEKLFLNVDKFEDVTTYDVGLGIEIKFKPLAFLTMSGWKYFAWVDTLVSDIKEGFSQSEYLRCLNWDSNLTLLKMMSNTKKDSGSAKDIKSPKTQ